MCSFNIFGDVIIQTLNIIPTNPAPAPENGRNPAPNNPPNAENRAPAAENGPNPAPVNLPNVENPALAPDNQPDPAPVNLPIANNAPEPFFEPHPMRARRAARNQEPFVCENPAFWHKIETLPDHLHLVFQPGCSLWDFRVYKEKLRQIITHFTPGLFMAQDTSKPELIRLFHHHVLANYGARYRQVL